MTLNRQRILSPNYSSRGGAAVRLIVIHSSEGAQSIGSLGNFFANPSSQVSSHTGIDNAPGNTIGEYVTRGNKAWTAANANPVAVQTELCTPSGASANWSRAQWESQTNMLANLAQWIREEAAAFGLPIVGLNAQQAQSNGRGVCQHKDLGGWGGGHVDCGPNFPFDKVMQMAGGSAPITPPPTQPPPTGGTAPPFPLPGGYYYGPQEGPAQSVSGYHPPYGGPNGAPGLRQWQSQMAARGWAISADGFYGNQTATVARQFQSEKGLVADGLIGPATWSAAWTAAIT